MTLRKTYSSSLALLLKDICHVPAVLDTYISGLALDSRKVKKGDVFFAVCSAQSNINDHIKQAIAKGANAIVAEGALSQGKAFEEQGVVELYVDQLKEKIGLIADRFFRSPSEDLSVVGVTGTNGKTSVTHYLANYFSTDNELAGVIGTLGYGLVSKNCNALTETGFTTPDVIEVHRCLAELRDNGAKNVFMEVSSHGLSQNRVDGVKFEGAVFTNLSHDHLDYHGSMQDYAASKLTLFAKKDLKFVAINKDDAYASQFINAVEHGTKIFTYGITSESDISVLQHHLNTDFSSGLHAEVSTPSGNFSIRSCLIGLFNLSNLLAVLAVAAAKQLLNDCEQKIQFVKPVKGRMQTLCAKDKPLVVIDFAHTPDALKNALSAVKLHCKGKLVLVFGCGGNRDTEKRKVMAEIAEAISDFIVVTDDNPRDETPSAITDQIFEGFSRKVSACLEHDREEAIKLALSKAHANDVVVIAGKGHETWQEVSGSKYFFSDLDAAKKALGIVDQGFCGQQEAIA